MKQTKIVILGGGFAGVFTAKRLVELTRDEGDISVELVSAENYFVFQPLLPEVAAGGIAPTHAVSPIRELVPGARFRAARVQSIDFENKKVLLIQGEGLELVEVPYDHLVFAFGKVTDFSSIPGADAHALKMKDLSDAFHLRNHVIRCLELADIEPDPRAKAALLNFVVAGGGFSGVETLGEICELVKRSLPYFPNIVRDEVRFQLIHSQDRILPEMPPSLSQKAREIFERRGIELLLNARVRACSRDNVYLADGRVLSTRTFVCTVGTAPSPLAKQALARGGFREAMLGGRKLSLFATDAGLECQERPGYWAVGDCAGVPSGDGLCPPTAQFAIREAKVCAENIVARVRGQTKKNFSFRTLGFLASLGERNAVAKILGVELTGFLAWFLWRTVYLFKLPGWTRRLRVALDWTLDLVFPRDITELKVFRHNHVDVQHFEAGESIVRRGQIGREFYLITQGKVEVLNADGTVLAELGPREVFGERALLEDTPRSATVRAREAVNLVVLSRSDFNTLVRSFPVLEDYFQDLLQKRHADIMPSGEQGAQLAVEPAPKPRRPGETTLLSA